MCGPSASNKHNIQTPPSTAVQHYHTLYQDVPSPMVRNKETLCDQLIAMRNTEGTTYKYECFLSPGSNCVFNGSWREKICQWTYNVADHFEFSREVVAVCLNIFDRYLATLGNTCPGTEALLISLGAMQIAVKLYEPKRVRFHTLATLSRGQFSPRDIEDMEWKIMEALTFCLNAPTEHSFVDYYLHFIPWDGASIGLIKSVSELSKYLTELAVCDPFFVPIPNSIVALAALLNVLDDLSYSQLSENSRTRFLSDLCHRIRINPFTDQVGQCRARMRQMVDVATGSKETDTLSSDRSNANSLGSACRFIARSTRSLMGPMMYAGLP